MTPRHRLAAGAFGATLAATLIALPGSPNGDASAASRGTTEAPRYPQWGSLAPGQYGVGFRLEEEYDRSRRVAPALDFEGRPNAGPLELPMTIGIWYPAVAARTAKPIGYGMFAALARRTDFAPVTAADRQAAVDGMRSFASFAFGREIPESIMRAVDTTSTAAVMNAAPAPGRFPVLLAETDGSIAAATVLFEYLASRGIAVIATPSRRADASLQVSRPNVVVETRVRDLEFLLDRVRRYPYIDAGRLAVLGVNFDGMATLAFQMKNMAARAIVSLDGWEGKENSITTVTSGLHYDPRRMRVPWLIVLQDEQPTPPGLRLDRTIFDAMRHADRYWLVPSGMSHAYLVGNPLAYPGVPADERQAYESLVRGIHGFLAAALDTIRRDMASAESTPTATPMRDQLHVAALPALPDDRELEQLIMRDRAADKVAALLREARRSDSSVTLFTEQTMALYAFRFSRQNDPRFAVRLLELNAESFPRSWRAAEALGDGYRALADTTRARAAYTRALDLLGVVGGTDSTSAESRSRQAIERKLADLRVTSG